MKIINFVFLTMLFTGIHVLNAQNNTTITAIIPDNFCQYYNSPQSNSFKVEFRFSGISDTQTGKFNAAAMNTDGVIYFNISDKTYHGARIANAEFSPSADFDFFKSFLQNNGVRFVSIEGQIITIFDWQPFTAEQCKQLSELNFTISNVEAKMKHVMEEPYYKNMAEGNGWFVEANSHLSNAREAKKSYLESIK